MAKCPLTADSLREQRQEIRIELQAGEKRFEGRLQSLAPDTRHAALPHAPVLRVLFPELPGREARGQRLAALAAPRECERLAEAIGQGGPLQALVARLQERQALAEGLGRQLAAKSPTGADDRSSRAGAPHPSEASRLARTAGAQRRGRPGSAQSAPHRADSLHACARRAAPRLSLRADDCAGSIAGRSD